MFPLIIWSLEDNQIEHKRVITSLYPDSIKSLNVFSYRLMIIMTINAQGYSYSDVPCSGAHLLPRR